MKDMERSFAVLLLLVAFCQGASFVTDDGLILEKTASTTGHFYVSVSGQIPLQVSTKCGESWKTLYTRDHPPFFECQTTLTLYLSYYQPAQGPVEVDLLEIPVLEALPGVTYNTSVPVLYRYSPELTHVVNNKTATPFQQYSAPGQTFSFNATAPIMLNLFEELVAHPNTLDYLYNGTVYKSDRDIPIWICTPQDTALAVYLYSSFGTRPSWTPKLIVTKDRCQELYAATWSVADKIVYRVIDYKRNITVQNSGKYSLPCWYFDNRDSYYGSSRFVNIKLASDSRSLVLIETNATFTKLLETNEVRDLATRILFAPDQEDVTFDCLNNKYANFSIQYISMDRAKVLSSDPGSSVILNSKMSRVYNVVVPEGSVFQLPQKSDFSYGNMTSKIGFYNTTTMQKIEESAVYGGSVTVVMPTATEYKFYINVTIVSAATSLDLTSGAYISVQPPKNQCLVLHPDIKSQDYIAQRRCASAVSLSGRSISAGLAVCGPCVLYVKGAGSVQSFPLTAIKYNTTIDLQTSWSIFTSPSDDLSFLTALIFDGDSLGHEVSNHNPSHMDLRKNGVLCNYAAREQVVFAAKRTVFAFQKSMRVTKTSVSGRLITTSSTSDVTDVTSSVTSVTSSATAVTSSVTSSTASMNETTTATMMTSSPESDDAGRTFMLTSFSIVLNMALLLLFA